jgi:type III pantothenate kinase
VTLLLDLGNTRLKAAWRRPEGGFGPLGEADHRSLGIAAALERALGMVPGGAPAQQADAALVANVAGEAAGESLATALRNRGMTVRFLRAVPEACGVRCAYAEPARLGADRWAALLGARTLTGGACLVVDAGSALTVDAMAPAGRHLGGWIIPGMNLMIDALEARTGDLGGLRRASPAGASAPFPADTAPAMEQGAQLAALGAVQLARARLEAHCGAPARLLVTGGDAGRLLADIGDAEHVPDLVLRGLARAADGLAAELS